MSNIKELSVSEIDLALTEAQQMRRSSSNQDVPPEDIMAIENIVTRLTNELRRRGL